MQSLLSKLSARCARLDSWTANAQASSSALRHVLKVALERKTVILGRTTLRCLLFDLLKDTILLLKCLTVKNTGLLCF
jgi:hypothetical protein